MNPDMPVYEMVDCFIYVVKGSRVIDRTATDWGQWQWHDEKYVKHHIYTLAELRRYFRHRVQVKVTRWPRYGSEKKVYDPFNEWFMHPRRFTQPTLSAAMQFANRAARGLVEPWIDIEGMHRRAIAPKPVPPPWEKPVSATLASALEDNRDQSVA